MLRVARIDIANYPYHVINRAVIRLPKFNDKKDYEVFEKTLMDVAQGVDMRILAYTIMPNH